MQIAQGNCQRWFTFDKNELSKATNSEQRLNILDGEGARTGVRVAKGGSRFRFKYLHLDLIFILNYFHLHESYISIVNLHFFRQHGNWVYKEHDDEKGQIETGHGSFVFIRNAVWSTWSAWSSCDATCGPGAQSRNRTCSVPGACSGEDREEKYCIRPCRE